MAGNRIDVDVDDEGRFMLKTDPMFAKELGRALREIAGMARTIVRTEHEHPRKVIVNRQVVTKKASGNLRRSIQPYAGRAAKIHKTSPHTISGEVSAGSSRAKYARFVHEGTRPHQITARPGRMLTFYGRSRSRIVSRTSLEHVNYGNGRRSATKKAVTRQVKVGGNERVVVVQSVNHKGYAGHRFLNQAAAIVLSRRYGAVVPAALVANGGFGGRSGPRAV